MSETFGLGWPGKADSFHSAHVAPSATLRPRRDLSIDFDTSEHVFIEGDNLEVLKLLQRSYHRAVKLIYIDPPYNTGSDFIYADDWREGIADYLRRAEARAGAKDDAGGRFHSRWLSMMAPRLTLARSLLAEDGVILVSIDDHELAFLKLLMNEVFGEENALTTLIWNKQHSQQQGVFKRYHEYVLVYARDASCIDTIKGGEGIIEAGAQKRVSRQNPCSEFEFPAGVRFEAPDGTTLYGTYGDSEKSTVIRGRMVAAERKTAEAVVLSAGWTQKNQMRDWFAGKNVVDTKGQKVLEFYFNSAGKLKCRKERSRITPPTLLPEYGMVSAQTGHLARLFGRPVFDNPKPVAMIADFLRWFVDEGDIVLDFFAGSATTCEAVLRHPGARFVAVQLPEAIGEGTTTGANARALGLLTIADLARARIRHVLKAGAFEAGFRAYELATPMSIRTDDEWVTEVLLREGRPLSSTVARVGSGSVFATDHLTICLEKHVSVVRVAELLAFGRAVICLDDAFDDAGKSEALALAARVGVALRTVS